MARACHDRATSADPVLTDGRAMLAPRRHHLRLHSRASNQTLEGRRPLHRRDGLARGRPWALILLREVRTGGWVRLTRQRRQDRTRPPRPRRRHPRQRQRRPRLPLPGAEKSRRVATVATHTAVAAAVVLTAAMVAQEVATLGATELPIVLAPVQVPVWLAVLAERTRVARTSRTRRLLCAGVGQATRTGPWRPQGRLARRILLLRLVERRLPPLRRNLRRCQ